MLLDFSVKYTKIRIMAIGQWSVVFYLDEYGRCPVEEFLESLDTKTQVRFDWSIEQLRLRNVQAREPLVRHLEGKIWELRRESDCFRERSTYPFSAWVPEENAEDTTA